MRIYADKYIGHKFGKLTVEAYDHSVKHQGKGRVRYTHYFRFRCECGGVIVSSIHNVLSGKTKTCGRCKVVDRWLGKKIGHCTIVDIVEVNGKKRFVLECECCGRESEVSQAVISMNQNNENYTCRYCNGFQKYENAKTV